MTMQSIDRASPVGLRDSEARSRDFLRQRAQGARQFLARYGLLLGFLLLWQVASRAGWINPAVLPPLDAIARRALERPRRRRAARRRRDQPAARRHRRSPRRW